MPKSMNSACEIKVSLHRVWYTGDFGRDGKSPRNPKNEAAESRPR